jgi:2-oxoglutarate ferredoxin oxidoreductase subunit alpha
MLLLDGNVGQIMEPAELPAFRNPPGAVAPWALRGADGRSPNLISSIELMPERLEAHNLQLQAKLARIAAAEVRWSELELEDAELVVVAFGTCGRVAQSAVRTARAHGASVGLLRPVSLWPFPSERIAAAVQHARGFLVVEMNAGQMVDDVRLAVDGRVPVRHFGRMGGMVPLPEEILEVLSELNAMPLGGVR